MTAEVEGLLPAPGSGNDTLMARARRGNGDAFALLIERREWRISPLEVDVVESAFFGDPGRFPRGSVALDNALIMRNVPHEWRALAAIDAA